MAVSNLTYAAAGTVTLTLTSLADGSWRQSTVVDNTSNLYLDALVGGIIQSGTLTAAGSIDIYAYGTYDGTIYTGGASGSDAAYTADGEETELVLIHSIPTLATTDDRDFAWGPVSVASAFGGTLPSKWGLVVENNTGATLNATGTNNETQFIGVTVTTA